MNRMYGNEIIEKLDNLIGKSVYLHTGVARVEGVLKNKQKVDNGCVYNISQNRILIKTQHLYNTVQIDDSGTEVAISIYR